MNISYHILADCQARRHITGSHQRKRREYAQIIEESKSRMVHVHSSGNWKAHLQRLVPEMYSSLQTKLPGTGHRMPQILRKVDCQKGSKTATYFITIYTLVQEWYRYPPSEFSPLLRPPKRVFRTLSLTNYPQRSNT